MFNTYIKVLVYYQYITITNVKFIQHLKYLINVIFFFFWVCFGVLNAKKLAFNTPDTITLRVEHELQQSNQLRYPIEANVQLRKFRCGVSTRVQYFTTPICFFLCQEMRESPKIKQKLTSIRAFTYIFLKYLAFNNLKKLLYIF